MKIAVEGCAHGELDNIYASLKYLEEIENIKIDLLICCGDFQAIRNENDLESLNCPLKYRTMGSFWRYYSGEVLAPIPTIFVGGNHEASNYLWELYYGGFAAPRIFYMGFAGVIRFGNVRIGGLSGIFKQYSYRSGHHEKLPYDKNDIKSVYHVREYDVQKLLQIKEPLDIFISHDWPRGITDYGNVKQLVRHKPYFETEIKEGNLGSKPGELLLKQLKPSYWFAGHLHTKFAAIVQHDKQGPVTKFLALDKCLPGRNFLQVIEVESGEGPHDFYYDEEWLAITRTYNSYLPLRKHFQSQRPAEQDLAVNRDWVKKRLADLGNKPLDFKMTVPPHNPLQRMSSSLRLQGHVRNPQTEAFLKLLDLPYLLDSSVECATPNKGSVASEEIANVADPNEIALDDEDAILSDEEIEDLSYSEITN